MVPCPTHTCSSTRAWDQALYLWVAKFQNFHLCLSHCFPHFFVQQLNFAHIPSFPHHLQRKTITLYMVGYQCRCWVYHSHTHTLSITYLTLYNLLSSSLDLFATSGFPWGSDTIHPCLPFFFLHLDGLKTPICIDIISKNSSNKVTQLYLVIIFIPPIYTQTIVIGGRTMGFLPSS
jgi:hypothetical protein